MSDMLPEPPQAPAPAATVAGQRSVWRKLAWALASLMLLLCLLAAVLAAAINTERGTQQLWRSAVWLLQGKLHGRYLGGNLAQGLQLRELHYQDATLQLDIDRIDARWQWSWSQRRFSVSYLRLGAVDLKLAPTPTTPTVLPASLQLPLALALREISLQHLRIQQGSSITALGQIRLHGDSDGTRHTLVLDQFDTGFGNASALLHLDGRRPFAASGSIALDGSYQHGTGQEARPEKFQLHAQLSGSLQELTIALQAGGDKLNGNATVTATPFATIPLKQAILNLQHINPRLFNPAAPQADLQLRADLRPATNTGAGSDLSHLRVQGPLEIVNLLPGSLDRQRLPLKSLHAELALSTEQQQLSALRVELLDHASLAGSGQFRASDQSGAFQFQLDALDLHALHSQLQPTRLRGPLRIAIQNGALDLGLQWQDPQYAVNAEATLTQDQLTLKQASLSAGNARLQLDGSLAFNDSQQFTLNGQLRNVDPARWLRQGAVAARINMDFDASGALAPQLQTKLRFNIHDSSYAALPMSGSGSLQLDGQRLLPSKASLQIAGNRLQLSGAFGNPQDRLSVQLDAPQLARLGYGLSGQLQLDGQLSGSLQRPALRASYHGSALQFGPHHLAQLQGQADLQTDLNSALAAPGNKLVLTLEGQQYRGPDATLQQLKLDLNGTYGAHTLSLQADGKIHGQTLALQFGAHGKLSQTQGKFGWSGMIDRLDNQGTPRITLGAPLALTLADNNVVAGATRLQIDRMALDLHDFSYQQGQLHTQGSAKALEVARILELLQQIAGISVPLKTDLVLDADWNIGLAQQASGFLQITRRSGDIALSSGSNSGNPGNSAGNTSVPAALGLSALQLRVDLSGTQARLQGQAAAARIGTLNTHGTLDLHPAPDTAGLLLPDADSALNWQALLDVPAVKNIAALLGPQYSLNGQLKVQLDASGTLGKPRLSGQINGDQLALTLFDQGIQLKDGIVRIVMDDNVIDLRQIEFHGSQGTLRASGKVQLGSDNPDLKASIVAERLQLFASPDRQLTLSGQAQLSNVADQLHIDGKFVVDQALFDLPKSSAPQLGDDVVIVHKSGNSKAGPASSRERLTAATEKPAGSWAPVIRIEVDLGNDFRFNGSGANLHLRGAMTVESQPQQALRATGTVQVADGTYEAFGTKLNIERGIINFQGPISNPNINILAMRRNQDVAAGVEVTGFANQPRVKLVSEPTVADNEKLSWLMFGHGSDSSGVGQLNASSQALALVGNYGGKKIAKGIGLDQFSIGSSESGLTDEQVISLGKSISDRLSLGYEQSLSGTASIAKATWQLSKRWSAVVRAGSINGIIFAYNLRFD